MIIVVETNRKQHSLHCKINTQLILKRILLFLAVIAFKLTIIYIHFYSVLAYLYPEGGNIWKCLKMKHETRRKDQHRLSRDTQNINRPQTYCLRLTNNFCAEYINTYTTHTYIHTIDLITYNKINIF